MDDSIEKGIEKGKELGLIESAKNLLDVLSDEVIAEKIGLSLEVVQELRKENAQESSTIRNIKKGQECHILYKYDTPIF